MKKELLSLIVVVAVFVTVGSIVLASKVLPEEHASEFNALSTISLKTDTVVIRQPTAGDNTYIYAINDVAQQSWDIAETDPRVKAILNEVKGRAVTIAAVQPTAFIDKEGRVTHSGSGQVIITANWQLVNGISYNDAKSFPALEGQQGESHQQIWSISVDLDTRKVVNIQNDQERVMVEILKQNIIYGGINMYLPNVVLAKAGSTVEWINASNIQHNVVGAYKTASGSVNLDSGFFKKDESWRHSFGEEGVFEYHCTIHAEEGMKGTIIVSK